MTEPRRTEPSGITYFVLDRIENGGWAVLLAEGDGPPLNVPGAWLPSDASEGDVVAVEASGDGTIRFWVDAARTAERAARVRELRDRIPRGPAGDLSL